MRMLKADKHPGIRDAFELAVRFHTWAQGLTAPLTPPLISNHFGVSRATAYRWRRAYQAAVGKAE